MQQFNYNVDYFIDKFSALDNWTTGILIDESGNRCALGHCGVLVNESYYHETDEARSLVDLLINWLPGAKKNYHKEVLCAVVTNINDDSSLPTDMLSIIKGDTPKERILNALEIVKEEQKKKCIEESIERVAKKQKELV